MTFEEDPKGQERWDLLVHILEILVTLGRWSQWGKESQVGSGGGQAAPQIRESDGTLGVIKAKCWAV